MDSKVRFIKIKGATAKNLYEIELQIKKGELTGLLGEAGSGKSAIAKSTLIRGYRSTNETLKKLSKGELSSLPPLESAAHQIEGVGQVIDLKELIENGRRDSVSSYLQLSSVIERILFKHWNPPCERCGGKTSKHSEDQIYKEISSFPDGEVNLYALLSDLSQIEENEKSLHSKGYENITRTDNGLKILIDSVKIPTKSTALQDSIKLALSFNNSSLIVEGEHSRFFSPRGACQKCGTICPEWKITDRAFSHSSIPTTPTLNLGGVETLDLEWEKEGALPAETRALPLLSNYELLPRKTKIEIALIKILLSGLSESITVVEDIEEGLTKEEIEELIATARKLTEHGHTVIITSRYNLVEKLVDTAIFLKEGQVVERYKIDELKFEDKLEEYSLNRRNSSLSVSHSLGLLKPIQEFYSNLELAKIEGLTPKEFVDNNPKIAEVRWRGISFPELLQQSIGETDPLLSTLRKCMKPYELIKKYRLLHLPLGRKLSELSSTELSRVKLIKEIS